MKLSVAIALLTYIGVACQVPEQEKTQETNILDNLPLSDRDLLLAPLESAFDDLKHITDNDPSLEEFNEELQANGSTGHFECKLNDGDTVYMASEKKWSNCSEIRASYYDTKGRLYYTEARIKTMNDAGGSSSIRDYKFYFEENGSILSLYGKTAFNEDKLPTVWTPICLTREEEIYLRAIK